MPQLDIAWNAGWGVGSWTQGFTKSPVYQQPLREEAKQCPQAVIFRLLRDGQETLAEEVMDWLIKKGLL